MCMTGAPFGCRTPQRDREIAAGYRALASPKFTAPGRVQSWITAPCPDVTYTTGTAKARTWSTRSRDGNAMPNTITVYPHDDNPRSDLTPRPVPERRATLSISSSS